MGLIPSRWQVARGLQNKAPVDLPPRRWRRKEEAAADLLSHRQSREEAGSIPSRWREARKDGGMRAGAGSIWWTQAQKTMMDWRSVPK